MPFSDPVTMLQGTAAGLRVVGTSNKPHPTPLDLVTYPSDLTADDLAAAMGPVNCYAGRSIVLSNGAQDKPMLLVADPDRLDLLPAHTADTWTTMRLALDRWAPGRTRRTFQGPHVAGLEWDVSRTIRTLLTGPSYQGRVQSVGYPAIWPQEVLSFVFGDAERIVLDPDPPPSALWRGRPPGGRSYVRIFAERARFIAWRREVLKHNPAAEVFHLPSHRSGRRQ